MTKHAKPIASTTAPHHAPVDPVVHDAVTEAPAATRPAGVSSLDPDQATLDQLNQQLATIRGLPQYADLERELTDRIAALTAPLRGGYTVAVF